MPFRTQSRPYLLSKSHDKAIINAQQRGDKYYVMFVGTNNRTGGRSRKIKVPERGDRNTVLVIRAHADRLLRRGFTFDDIMRMVADA